MSPDIHDYARAVREFLKSFGVMTPDGQFCFDLDAYLAVSHLTVLVLDGAPAPDAVVPVHEEIGGEGGGA